MLGKWIYYGIIEDQFEEFMIVDKCKEGMSKQLSENYDWNERYTIKDDNTPSFLQRQANKILSTGKYLNVIKAYDKSRSCPHCSDLVQNLEDYLQKQDFSPCILRAFEWANEELINIVMKEEKLLDR